MPNPTHYDLLIQNQKPQYNKHDAGRYIHRSARDKKKKLLLKNRKQICQKQVSQRQNKIT